ncbi:uncharacterized protein LOC111124981 [Crassostrea virginica]
MKTTLIALSCCHDSDCYHLINCYHHQHGACILGHCHCVECARHDDCPHCSHRTHICHCSDCTHDAHCQNCSVGVTGECIYSHSSHKFHCHCPATTTTTTTTQPLVPLDCSNQKISVIESIAENLHVEDDRAGLCPGTNNHQTSEALVIHKCNSMTRSSWSKGDSVKATCASGSLPQYTPISTFLNNGNELAAFFVDCSADGSLKIAAQTCNYPPKVLEVDETTSPKVSDFYTILQS